MASASKHLTAAERRVREAVIERSKIDGYPCCEAILPNGQRCAHNGSVFPLEVAHITSLKDIWPGELIQELPE